MAERHLLSWLVGAVMFNFIAAQPRTHFKAAVYEHAPIIPDLLDLLDPSKASVIINRNLDIYEEQVQTASELNVDIIVFPEDGLHGVVHNRETIYPYLEDIPDPKTTSWNPCRETQGDNRFLIQRRLSCMAQQNNLYIVANMGDVKHCDWSWRAANQNPRFKLHVSQDCPDDGRLQYNTNVVFDPRGQLVARYHKQTLYYETQFDQPREVEFITFDTPFGKFGTFVCFDILFEEPAMDLVRKYKVDSIAFSTAWQSKLPLMQGVAFHEAWAVTMGVNLLSAELHIPTNNFTGSGIYAGAEGALAYYLNRSAASPGNLLVSTLPIKAKQTAKTVVSFQPEPPPRPDAFESEVQHDLYTFLPLDGAAGELFVSMKDTHCHMLYSFKNKESSEMYAFGAYDGLHSSAHNSYVQVCILLKCATSDTTSCGQPVLQAASVFDYFHITGQFQTTTIFPIVVINEGGVGKEFWEFYEDIRSPQAALDSENLAQPVVSAALYARLYNRDAIGRNNTIPEKFLPVSHVATINELNELVQHLAPSKAADGLSPGHIAFLVIFAVVSVASVIYSLRLMRR